MASVFVFMASRLKWRGVPNQSGTSSAAGPAPGFWRVIVAPGSGKIFLHVTQASQPTVIFHRAEHGAR